MIHLIHLILCVKIFGYLVFYQDIKILMKKITEIANYISKKEYE